MAAGNDNHGPNRPLRDGPDGHGQAAFLLVESLIHALREIGVLSTEQAIEIVTTAAEVERDLADVRGELPSAMRRSLALLGEVVASLRTDSRA